MSTDRDVTRLVRSWLEEGATALPDRVLDAVLDQVPATPQRRASWPARRSTDMNNVVKLLIAAAAIVVIAVVGLNLLPRGGGIGGPAPTPSPTAAPTPSPTPSPTPVALTAGQVGVLLNPGTYHVPDAFAVPFSIAFGSEWIPKAMTSGDVEFRRSTPQDGAVWISLDIVDGVYADPCHASTGPTGSPATSTVQSLTDALTHMVGFPAGSVSDVEIGGHPAKAFVLTNAIDTTTAGCTYGPMLPILHFVGGPDGGGTNGGATEQIWVVDVNGTPVVIDGESFPNTPAADIEEMKTAVASIAFE